jgi:hypothetical protein
MLFSPARPAANSADTVPSGADEDLLSIIPNIYADDFIRFAATEGVVAETCGRPRGGVRAGTP